MQEWLLLLALAATPSIDEDRFSSQENCQSAGREWYAQMLQRDDYERQCKQLGVVDRCKFVCVTASAQ